MKQQLTFTETSLPAIRQAKQSLYSYYGAMLLGYITEVIKNESVAEQFLIDIFSDLGADDIKAIFEPGTSAFCRLQQIARKGLATFNNTVDDCETYPVQDNFIKGNRVIDMMNYEQQQVFCGVHYHGKSTAKLAAELNKSETSIRQLLKDSFTIIRNNRK